MKMSEVRQGVGALWGSVAEGWQRLRDSAASALTRFRASDKSNLPARSDVDDQFYLPSNGWSMLGGDVFEDDRRLVVRLEIPGMSKRDFDIEVLDDVLVVRGEKRFERETSEGRWRVIQCAYGSFLRSVPLPVPVRSDKASASYKDGVLRIELPKVEPGRPRRVTLKVD
jgi:HSP20 family protein